MTPPEHHGEGAARRWMLSICSECRAQDGGETLLFHMDGCSRQGRRGDASVEVVELVPAAIESGDQSIGNALPVGREQALRLADVQEMLSKATLNEDTGELQDPCGLLSALDYAVRGDPGCVDPDEWASEREAALAKHSDYLALPVSGDTRSGESTRPVTEEDVEAGARVVDPFAFDGSMLRIGCDGPWHYEGHGILSSCPTCGGTRFAGREYLRGEQDAAQERAIRKTRAVLEAVAARHEGGGQ